MIFTKNSLAIEECDR